MKALVIAVIIAGIFIGGSFFLAIQEAPDSLDDSSGLIIGKNTIYVAEQVPSRTLAVAVVRLEKPGFVIVHEDASGAPGRIMGISDIVSAGETAPLAPITLSRMTRDGETLYAMLHFDDGDSVFNTATDHPIFDNTTRVDPVMMIIAVSAEAIEPGAVSL